MRPGRSRIPHPPPVPASPAPPQTARREDASSDRSHHGSAPAEPDFDPENRGAWKECLALLPPGPDAVRTLPPPRRDDRSCTSVWLRTSPCFVRVCSNGSCGTTCGDDALKLGRRRLRPPTPPCVFVSFSAR